MTSTNNPPTLLRAFWLALGIALIVNVIFLLCLMALPLVPKNWLASQTKSLFAAGILSSRGEWSEDNQNPIEHFNDCMTLQLLLTPQKDALSQALDPLSAIEPQWFNLSGTDRIDYPLEFSPCANLHNSLYDLTQLQFKNEKPTYHYYRFWHGNRLIYVALLALHDHTRMAFTWLPIALPFLALSIFALALKSIGAYSPIPYIFLIMGLMFRGNIALDSSIGISAGFSLNFIMAAAFLHFGGWWRRSLLLATIWGCLEFFFDWMFYYPLSLSLCIFCAAIKRESSEDRDTSYLPMKELLYVGAFWIIGFATTACAKQGLAFLVYGSEPLMHFYNSLMFRVSASLDTTPMCIQLNRATSIKELLDIMSTLMPFNSRVSLISNSLSLGVNAAAAMLLVKRSITFSKNRFQDPLTVSWIMIWAIYLSWVWIFHQHTVVHSYIVSKHAFLPLAIGWIVLFNYCRPSAGCLKDPIVKNKVR